MNWTPTWSNYSAAERVARKREFGGRAIFVSEGQFAIRARKKMAPGARTPKAIPAAELSSPVIVVRYGRYLS